MAPPLSSASRHTFSDIHSISPPQPNPNHTLMTPHHPIPDNDSHRPQSSQTPRPNEHTMIQICDEISLWFKKNKLQVAKQNHGLIYMYISPGIDAGRHYVDVTRLGTRVMLDRWHKLCFEGANTIAVKHLTISDISIVFSNNIDSNAMTFSLREPQRS